MWKPSGLEGGQIHVILFVWRRARQVTASLSGGVEWVIQAVEGGNKGQAATEEIQHYREKQLEEKMSAENGNSSE